MVTYNAIRGILLDIEGTTTPIQFVHDVMFPFARRELPGFLENFWENAEFCETLDLLARDAGASNWTSWRDGRIDKDARQFVHDHCLSLMDRDVKATGLKRLQGHIWRSGFESGELRGDVYDDVPEALRQWNEAGMDIRIYSSGSVEAQKLFFAHTTAGNLLPYLHDHYDTKIGSKKESASYLRIAEDYCLEPAQVLFVSDIPEELNAARQAGLQTALAVRLGNAPVPVDLPYPRITSFRDLQLVTN